MGVSPDGALQYRDIILSHQTPECHCILAMQDGHVLTWQVCTSCHWVVCGLHRPLSHNVPWLSSFGLAGPGAVHYLLKKVDIGIGSTLYVPHDSFCLSSKLDIFSTSTSALSTSCIIPVVLSSVFTSNTINHTNIPPRLHQRWWSEDGNPSHHHHHHCNSLRLHCQWGGDGRIHDGLCPTYVSSERPPPHQLFFIVAHRHQMDHCAGFVFPNTFLLYYSTGSIKMVPWQWWWVVVLITVTQRSLESYISSYWMVGNIKSISSNHVLVLIDVRTFNDALKTSYYVQSLKKSLRHVKITEPVVFYVKNDHLTIWFIWFLNKN